MRHDALVEATDSLWELSSPSTMWVLGNGTQVAGLGGRCLCLLGLLTSPRQPLCFFFPSGLIFFPEQFAL